MTRRRSEDYVPLVYLVVALLLAVALLPSILRQNPPETSQTAELSPDAPPDEQQSIVASFNRAVSGTAGDGIGEGIGEGEGDGPAGGLGPIGLPAPKRGCRFGVGNPPRTSSSPYAAQCVPAWLGGDNGGATSKGVTATEIRIAVGYANGSAGTDGPVGTQPREGDTAADVTLRTLQTWFNTRYEFYGRQLRFYVKNYGEAPANQRTAAAAVDDEYKVFGASMGRWAMMAELARRGIVTWGEQGDQYTERFLGNLRPYAWQTVIQADRAAELSGEYICKKLWGKNARFSGDPVMQGQERKIGVLYTENPGYTATVDAFERALSQNCGAKIAEGGKIGFATDMYAFSDGGQLATGIAKLRQAGVTTVVQFVDMSSMGQLTKEATAQAYFPEWFITGVWLTDDTFFAKTFLDQAQWKNAFGISSREIDNLDSQHPGRMAYREIEPNGSPDANIMCCVFWGLEQLANGIQMAGPNLTPKTFEQGLLRMTRRPPEPLWAMTGEYSATDHAYADRVAEIWWSPEEPSLSGVPGAYMYVRDGQRFGPGEIPREDPKVFQEGSSSAELRRRYG